MKKKFFFLTMLVFCMTARSQVSGIERLEFENSYFADSTIVRNYNDTFSVVMSYGHYENTPAINGLFNSSSFILRDNTNSSMTHIVSLPIGYQVNDVRFVSLTRKLGGEDLYCCFCGTRYIYKDMYAMVDSNGNPTNMYYYVYDSVGFAGFFWMKEALSPNTSCTAKVRDVEKAKQLFRMTCYAQSEGSLWNMQSTYRDNAVLDIVGVPKSYVNAASAFWRVKFYPVFPPAFQPSGTRWDNNIRYDTLVGIEKMVDVTQTDNYVVTVSKSMEDDNRLWLRFSGKETTYVYNGLQLSSLIHPLKMNTLNIGGELLPEGEMSIVETPRVCGVHLDEFAVAYRMQNDEFEHVGLLTFRHDLTSGTGSATLDGLYNNGDYMLDDLIYMYWHDVTATLQRHRGSRAHITDANYWLATMYSYNLCRRFSVDDINLQSICFYRQAGDVMLWSGIDAVTQMPPYILYQFVPSPKDMYTSCLEHEDILSTQTKIDMGEETYEFPICERFYDVWENYPVSFCHFDPYEINAKSLCEKKE